MTARPNKLERLGAKLDAMIAFGGIDWTSTAAGYQALAIKLALAAKPPRVTIKSTAGYWHATAMRGAAHARLKTIQDDADDVHSIRAHADLQAAYSVAYRDFQIIADAIRTYDRDKRDNKKAWRDARRIVKIPERDRLPQKVTYGR